MMVFFVISQRLLIFQLVMSITLQTYSCLNINEQRKIEVASYNCRRARYKYIQHKTQIKKETNVT